MLNNDIECSRESIVFYNQLKANGTRDSEVVEKMKAKGY